MDTLLHRIKELAAQAYPEVVAIRRDLHAHPELSFDEHRTASKVCEYLDKWGIPYQKGVAKTGVVALLEGRNPNKKIIALRADMDALPIQETNEVDYKSVNEGIMHACGHDVHTASVLGTAYILSQLKDSFEGTVKFIFQPSEEKLPGGASVMIAEGVLENPKPSAIYGQHVYPDLPAGKVGFRPGMYMASCDEIYVTVKGKGGHGALPHCNIDPVLISAHMIVALQQIVSRNADPRIPTVLSFGKVIANGATNIIPNEVYLEGTFRTLNEEWRNRAHQLMVQQAEGIAQSMGGSVDFRIEKGYPFLTNDPALTSRAMAAAKAFLGNDNVIDLDVRMTAEDFSWYTQLLPACFYRLGTSSPDGQYKSSVHTPNFNIDENALQTGMGLMAWLAVDELGS
jgi:amidohydrolase